MDATTEGLNNILKKVLNRILAGYPEVNSAIIVTKDGLPIASEFSKGVSMDNKRRVAAILEAIFPLPEDLVIKLEKGAFEPLFIKSSDGYLTVLQFVSNDLLILSATRQLNKFDLKMFSRPLF